MSERKRLILEALGGLLLIAGLSVIHIALGLVAAGVLFVLAANFMEVNDADSEQPDR